MGNHPFLIGFLLLVYCTASLIKRKSMVFVDIMKTKPFINGKKFILLFIILFFSGQTYSAAVLTVTNFLIPVLETFIFFFDQQGNKVCVVSSSMGINLVKQILVQIF